MAWGYYIATFIHDLAIAVYLGGAVAMEFVLTPAQQSIPPAQAQIMGEKSSARFLLLVWTSLALILLTGLLRLYFRGQFFGEELIGPMLSPASGYGRTLLTMLFIWCLLAVNGCLITFVYRPILSAKLAAGSSAAQTRQAQETKLKAATRIQLITRIDLALAVFALALGASLAQGALF